MRARERAICSLLSLICVGSKNVPSKIGYNDIVMQVLLSLPGCSMNLLMAAINEGSVGAAVVISNSVHYGLR